MSIPSCLRRVIVKSTLLILTSLALFLILYSCTRKERVSTPIPYLQPLPDSSALIFLPGVVSKEGLDFNSAISPEGNEFYFTRSRNGQWDIYVTKHDGMNWSEPMLASFSDPKYSEADPAFSPDGRLFFISDRPKRLADTLSDFDIWFVKQSQPDSWSEPENFGEINSDSAEYYISFATNGNAYFGSSRKGGYGAEDIYVSKFVNGAYTRPENLGSTINTKESEHDPCIWPKEDVLVFKSENHNDGFGEADLYASKFTSQNGWSQSVNLGDKFNTKTYEYCPYLTPDGKYFFFSSEFDVKWIDAKFLENHIDSIIKQ